MSRKTIERVLSYTIVLFVFASVIYVYFIKEDFDFKHKGKMNIGTVNRIGGNSTTSDRLQHVVNGKAYNVSFVSQIPRLTLGEKFYLLYNPENPNDALVLVWKPVFLSEELVIKTRGKVTNITDVGFGIVNPSVAFEYFIENNKVIHRTQKIPKDFINRYPDLVLQKEYEVEYWLKNPQRSIIYLDRPLK